MKAWILRIALLLTTIPLFSLDKLDQFEVGVGLVPGGLLDGKQKELFSSSLSPKPTDFSYFGLILNAKYFPVENFGVYLGTNFLGTVSVSSKSTTPLKTLNLGDLEVGLASRYGLDIGSALPVTLNLNLGLTYSSMAYDSAYKSLVPSGYYLYDISPDFGFFLEGGVEVFATSNVYVGGSLKYSTINGKINQTSTPFTGSYLTVPITVGLAF